RRRARECLQTLPDPSLGAVPTKNAVRLVTIEVAAVPNRLDLSSLSSFRCLLRLGFGFFAPRTASPGERRAAPPVGRFSSRRSPSSLHAGTRRGLSSCG